MSNNLEIGDEVPYFWVPHPRCSHKDQQWNNGKVVDVNGKYIKISANVHYGKRHMFWIEKDKVTLPI